MMNDKRIINKYSWFSIGFFFACLLIVFITACVDNWAIGKSNREIEKELSREMFVVDSLLGDLRIMLGDSSIIELNTKRK